MVSYSWEESFNINNVGNVFHNGVNVVGGWHWLHKNFRWHTLKQVGFVYDAEAKIYKRKTNLAETPATNTKYIVNVRHIVVYKRWRWVSQQGNMRCPVKFISSLVNLWVLLWGISVNMMLIIQKVVLTDVRNKTLLSRN